ncbi:hypothetical protein [Candidatus Lariskella endosymbiont of Hedychridium roseum]|uniref:hypothetical protein n=1 Tax=Candidatus Lariskella endosymbiont of Hedychridium roseum TaxID=3077949 RepID=UPI0030CBC6BB
MKSFRYGDVKQLQYSGMQKGLGANLSILALDNLYCSGDFSTYKTENEKEDIKYQGTLNNIEVNLGYAFDVAERSQVIPYFKAAHRKFSARGVEKSGDTLNEEVRSITHATYGIGIIHNGLVGEGWVLSQEAFIGRNTDCRIIYQSLAQEYLLSPGMYYGIELKTTKFINEFFSINASVGFKVYNFGESDKHKTRDGSIEYELKSNNSEYIFSIGASIHF